MEGLFKVTDSMLTTGNISATVQDKDMAGIGCCGSILSSDNQAAPFLIGSFQVIQSANIFDCNVSYN